MSSRPPRIDTRGSEGVRRHHLSVTLHPKLAWRILLPLTAAAAVVYAITGVHGGRPLLVMDS